LITASTDAQSMFTGGTDDEIIKLRMSCGSRSKEVCSEENICRMVKGDWLDLHHVSIANCQVGDDIEIYMEEQDFTTNDRVTYTIPSWRYASLPAGATFKVRILLDRSNIITMMLDLADKTGVAEVCVSDLALGGLGYGAKVSSKAAGKAVKSALKDHKISPEALKRIDDLKQLDKNLNVVGSAREATVDAIASAAGFVEFGCLDGVAIGNQIAKALGLTGTAVYEATIHIDGFEAKTSRRSVGTYDDDPCAVSAGSSSFKTLPSTFLLFCLCLVAPLVHALH